MPDEKDTHTVSGSHVMSTDSGMGSCLSVASSYFTPTGSMTGSNQEPGKRKTSSDSHVSCGEDVVSHPKVANKKHRGKSPTSSPSKDKSHKKEAVSNEKAQHKGETNNISAQEKKTIDRKVSEPKNGTKQTASSGSSPVSQEIPDSKVQPTEKEKSVAGICMFLWRLCSAF